jgi:hypothetical protein
VISDQALSIVQNDVFGSVLTMQVFVSRSVYEARPYPGQASVDHRKERP